MPGELLRGMKRFNLKKRMKYFYVIALMFLFACTGKSENASGGDKNNPVATSESATKEPISKVISADEFENGIQSSTPINLIDVRTPEEIADGFIEGAILMNFNAPDFANQLKTLDASVPTFIYCRSGGRSGQTAKMLQDLGFKEVYDLKGGITEWVNQNKPISLP